MSGDTERQIEALLFAAAGPLSLEDLAKRLPANADVPGAIVELQKTYEGRGVELACVAGRWRFQTAQDLAFLMTEEREEPRALLWSQRAEHDSTDDRAGNQEGHHARVQTLKIGASRSAAQLRRKPA